MQAIIFDTETTGLDAPEVIETAWYPVDIHGRQLNAGLVGRFRPSKAISMEAMATHHIMDEDLVDCPPSASFALPDGVEYVIGHNVDYDWRAIGEPAVRRICTCAMARLQWPAADSHSLGAMLYLLERSSARRALSEAHSAHADVINCNAVLRHIIDRVPFWDFEELWRESERMRIPKVMTFGKHKGMAIADVPSDYKRWLLNQPDVDVYLQQALRA